MSIWFTSDLHLGHRFVAGLRDFDNPEDHDSFLAAQWEARVHPEDHVWVLGDLAASSPARALEILKGLPGIKHLVAGNHDSCHPMHRDSHKWQRRYLEVFESVQAFARRRIEGQQVLLSHFPYSADRGEVRYEQYRLRDMGEWLLHGHTHSRAKLTSDREIHVGVDAWDLAPVSLEVIREMMASE